MKTWQIYLLIGVVVVVGIGAIFFLSSRNGNETKNSNEVTDSQDPAEDNNTKSETAQSENKTSAPCTRTVNNKIMQEKIDIKNKFVTMSIEGFGDVKIQLFDQDAPKTVENFLRLSASGYYDCLTFHRIIPGFVVQGGDPTGTGAGGESVFGAKFEDELNPDAPSFKTGYVKGVVAMANSGPNTNGSQFFFTLADLNQSLGKLYTIFGKVVEGQDVVDKIGLTGDQSGKPKNTVTITKAVVSDK